MILQHMHKFVQRSKRFGSPTSVMHGLNIVLDNGTKTRHINHLGRLNSPGQPKLPGAADDRHLQVSMRDGFRLTILRELPLNSPLKKKLKAMKSVTSSLPDVPYIPSPPRRNSGPATPSAGRRPLPAGQTRSATFRR